MKTFLAFLLTVLSLLAADPAQPKVGVTPVLNATNGFGGILTIRTQINVGYTGQAGFIEMRSAEPTNYGALYLSPSNWIFSVNATDEYDGGAFTLVVTNEIHKADLLQIYNGPNLEVYIQYDGSILGQRLFAEDAPFSDNYTRIQPTNTKINIGVNTNYISFDAATGIIQMFHEGTNTFLVLQDSGLDGSQVLFLSSDGLYHPASGGAGVTNFFDNVYITNLFAGNTYISNLFVTNITMFSNVTFRGRTEFLSSNTFITNFFFNNTYITNINQGGGGGGGDTIWTNNAGIIELIGSTDVQLNPAVADGPSVVAFSLNSSNYITDGSALLLAVQNHGTNHLTLDPDGGLKVSGEDATSFIQTYNRSNPNNYFYADNEPLIALGFGGTERTKLIPIAADGTTPYTFDTSLAHTSGNLAEFKNNGTNVVTIGAGPGRGIDVYSEAGSVQGSYIELNDENGDNYGAVSTRFMRIYDSDAGGFVTHFFPSVADGQTPYTFDTSVTHTAGNLAEFANNGTNVVTINNGGATPALVVHRQTGETLSLAMSTAGHGNIIAGTGSDLYFGANNNNNGDFVMLGGGSPALAPVSDNSADLGSPSSQFKRIYVGSGIASKATDTAVTIASTGWTNTFGKNAAIYLDGIGLTFTVYNNASTPVYTNSVSLVGATVLLQPSGKVIITAGTLGVGRATPF